MQKDNNLTFELVFILLGVSVENSINCLWVQIFENIVIWLRVTLCRANTLLKGDVDFYGIIR